MGRLTTHILDTAGGCPATGVKVQVFTVAEDARRLSASAETNADGRVDQPLIAEGDLQNGIYEIDFHIGAYFAARKMESFLDVVTVRFSATASECYHVPLLVSPFGYSTYRGS